MIEQNTVQYVLLPTIIFLVATIYSSVGHGGASGYLAVLSFFSYSPEQMSSSALLLNVMVATLAFAMYWRGGHKLPAFSWLIILVAVPFAFFGGMLRVDAHIYKLLLSAVLVFAAIRIGAVRNGDKETELRLPHTWSVIGSGSAIGLLSGIVGVGGGIFLSPLALLLRWATVKPVATLSAVFILVNSLAGLAGRAVTNSLTLAPATGVIAGAFLGGLLGSYFGANRVSPMWLRRLLAIVLVIASIKLILTSIKS
ncbi:MAG: sulfite exporter TauE/SafE family protein [Calditrichaeota bacterium]|nr:sulfite exporter TauE/SafE family protein [Calditrichota bacterium]MCB9367546.1 sulfite exporter TauE/SafE family protein [Calditrichota bacterium]